MTAIGAKRLDEDMAMLLITEAVSLAQEVGWIDQSASLGGEGQRPAGVLAGSDHGLRLGLIRLPHTAGGFRHQALFSHMTGDSD